MQYKNIIGILFFRFPEIQYKYEEEKDYLEGLPHLVFEIIFAPYIKEVMLANNKKKRIEVINFLEEMMSSGDEKIQEIVVVSVLEAILSDRELIEKIRCDLGVKTKQILKSIEKSYGWV